MRWLIFLSRAAFLCGLFMVLAFSLLFVPWEKNETISSSIIMAGYGLAVIMLPLVNLSYLVAFIAGRKPAKYIGSWLIVANAVLLFILLIFSFYINDPYYH